MTGMVDKSRSVNGVPTSLKDLGYVDVGLDDNWQLCGHYGPDKYTFHSPEGRPVVVSFALPPLCLNTQKRASEEQPQHPKNPPT